MGLFGDSKPITADLNTGLPTMLVYVLAGQYFVKGLTAGAVKG